MTCSIVVELYGVISCYIFVHTIEVQNVQAPKRQTVETFFKISPLYVPQKKEKHMNLEEHKSKS